MNAKMLLGKLNNIFLFSLLCLINHSFAQSDANFPFSFSSNRNMIYDYSCSEPFLIRQMTNCSGYHKNMQSDTLILNRSKQLAFVNYFQLCIKKQEEYCSAASNRDASLLWKGKSKKPEHYYTDYVILNNGDTIYGKRYRGMFNRYEIRFRSDEGKIKLLHKDVKEIYSKNKISWVYLSPCDNRWEEYTVYLKGKVSYMWNEDKNAYCSDMLIINNEIYPIDKSHFSDKVWNILIKCPVFEEKYNAFYKEHKDKKLFWRTRKNVEKWMEMIRFYNGNCEEFNP